ncbi:MAG: RNA polymerase factor sigma-54 [Bacteroidia bacterium]|nr:RNA polymerase factor sigma-54 [Bacteroidia bacterium]MCX7652910.1 RNA polymerase factor sigma-54 [Bacteroidia bacterium]MDW8416622.1 RNA polymerase factor sigma-54 [Bacteroidia bacterium]
MPSSRLSQVQRQVLRQNQRQIQLARLLEVPTEELDKYINQELEKNEGLEIEGEEPLNLPEGPLLLRGGYSSGTNDEEGLSPIPHTADRDDTEDFYGPYNFSAKQTLYESLMEQLPGLELSPRERAIAEYLIGNLDERGYLTESVGRLARLFSMDTAQGFPVSESEMEAVLSKIQSLEPPGIAARSPQECLYLQAKALPEDDPQKPYLMRLLGQDFHLFAARRFDKLRELYKLSETEWNQLIERLRSFSLAPGASLSEETAPQVQPDFLLRIESDGTLRVELTRWYAPRLRVSSAYKRLLEQYDRKKSTGELSEVLRHIKDRVERAEQFIQLLHQREITLLRTAEEIIRHQRLFFLSGCDERQLRPLVLRQVAEAVKVDISTVSRVVNSKYIETPCGVYPLKFFFSEGLRSQDGKQISNKAVKRLLQDIIAQEPPNTPLSDEKLVKLLRERGIDIKRRTVAKYREQLGIPSARERKRII